MAGAIAQGLVAPGVLVQVNLLNGSGGGRTNMG